MITYIYIYLHILYFLFMTILVSMYLYTYSISLMYNHVALAEDDGLAYIYMNPRLIYEWVLSHTHKRV